MAFVHPNPEAQAAAIAAEHGLQDVSRFSDPDGVLYRALGLGRAGIGDFFRWSVIKRYLEALRGGHRGSKPTADVLRMPGVFLIDGGKVIGEYRHRTPADRPDYTALAGA